MNPGVGCVPATAVEVRLQRGLVLPGRVWCAERPRALVAVVHGLGEHSARYAALADDLVQARLSVVARPRVAPVQAHPGWLERLALWADAQPAHRRLGSWTMDC